MAVISGTYVVDAPVDLAFEATHSVLEWPQANPLVKAVEIVEQEGNKTVFKMTHADGRSWLTAMFAVPEARVSYSERLAPQPPLKCMQYVRSYRATDAGSTEITEEVRFELLEDSGIDEVAAAQRMRAHMVEVQPHLKRHVEARARHGKEVSHDE